MQNIYIYIENEHKENCIKYGIKLSEYANKIMNIENTEKKGIIAFLSPKDSDLYQNNDYTCLRIDITNLNVIVFNNVTCNTQIENEFICDIKDYKLGEFEEPVALICSTILPENITLYNKIIDFPIIVENSKEFYYQKAIQNMMENEKFSSFEIYQLLLILGEKKGIFKVNKINDKLKTYIELKSKKTYTKKSNF